MSEGPREVVDIDSPIAEALARHDTGLLSDALERVDGAGVPVGIRPLAAQPRRIAGRAVTVRLGPVEACAPEVHLGARAIDAAEAGDVIAVANDGRLDVAAWGGLLSIAAAVKGVAGVVIDGACRDVDDQWDPDVEIFCRGIVPLTARGRIAERAFNEPVRISGIRVAPGDWIVGDGSGVVVVPADRAEETVAEARRLSAREAELREAILAGRPVSEVLDSDYETLLEEGE